jgi:hypothetical protein
MFSSRLLRIKRFAERSVKYQSVPVVEGTIVFYGHCLFTRCTWITNVQEIP